MENGIINVGIAGFGMSGQVFHAPFLDADDRFRIRKVYERSTQRAKERYPYVEVVRSFEELLTDDIDLVVVSTPNSLHYQMAKSAMEAGKAVVVEKPVASSADEAQELCELAERKGVLFTVYQNRRLDGDFRTIRKLMDEGAFGKVCDYEAHFDRFAKGGSSKAWKREGGIATSVFYDLGVHLMDQAYMLFGMPREVYADILTQRPGAEGPDSFRMVLYYADGLRVVLSAGQSVPMPGSHFMIHGRKGSFIKYGMDVQEADLVSGKRPIGDDWGRDAASDHGIYAEVTGEGIVQHVIPTIPGDYRLFYDDLYKAMTDGTKPMVDPRGTVEVLRVMEAALKSSEEKRVISI